MAIRTSSSSTDRCSGRAAKPTHRSSPTSRASRFTGHPKFAPCASVSTRARRGCSASARCTSTDGGKMKAIRFHYPGDPSVIRVEDVQLAAPKPHEITVRNEHIGVNFIDTYHRSGLYPLPLPSGLGMEAAGTVVALGSGVTDLAVGDRVAYCSGPIGAYSEQQKVPAVRTVKLSSKIGTDGEERWLLRGL